MVTDTIGDYLTRIRNAQVRGKKEISMPSSKMLVAISKVLKEEGFIEDFSESKNDKVHNELVLRLRYVDNVKPAIKGAKRMSKPGVRIYAGYRDIPKVLGGLGLVIITTSKGIMSGQKAKNAKLGGELICKIW